MSDDDQVANLETLTILVNRLMTQSRLDGINPKVARFWEKTYKSLQITHDCWLVMEWSNLEQEFSEPREIPPCAAILALLWSEEEADAFLEDQVRAFKATLGHTGRWHGYSSSGWDEGARP